MTSVYKTSGDVSKKSHEPRQNLCGSPLLTELRQATYKTIERVNYIHKPVSYSRFFQDYLWPNKPCVFGSFVTETWRSRQEWVNADGKPNTEFISTHFGEAEVPVADCEREEYSSHPKQTMKVSEYMSYFSASQTSKLLYLKDWHFVRVFPAYQAYSVPVYFKSDWLNEFWDKRGDVCDDYRFVYIGKKGTWTPFHADVFHSYSWSANVCGKKRWLLFPPGEEEKLRDNHGNLPFDLTSSDTLLQENLSNCRMFEVIQEAGQAIFVPSGWHHQVFNLEDTISINHNWINACNLGLSWKYLVSCLKDVKKEIDDCKGMEGWNEQCQLILRTSSGIDYKEFYNFIRFIAMKRIAKQEDAEASENLNLPSGDTGHTDGSVNKHQNLQADISQGSDLDDYVLEFKDTSIKHTLFDLIQIKLVLKKMLDNADFQLLNTVDSDLEPCDLLTKIKLLCSDPDQ